MNPRGIAIIAALLALFGCAATVTRIQNEAPITIDARAGNNVIVTFGGTETVAKSNDWETFKGAVTGRSS